MKKKAKRAAALTQKRSPYSSTIVSLHFEDSVLQLPQQILKKCPILNSRLQDQLFGSLQIEDMTYDVGHVLVHYLFTESYGTLDSNDATENDAEAAELNLALNVYDVAKAYELWHLKDLAQKEIQRLCDLLRLPVVWNVMQDHFSPTRESVDEWTGDFLRRQIQSAMTSEEAISTLLKELGNSQSINSILPQCFLAKLFSMELDTETMKPAGSWATRTESEGESVEFVDGSEISFVV